MVKELCEGSDLVDMMMVMVVEVVIKLKVVMEMMLAGQGGCRILLGQVTPTSPLLLDICESVRHSQILSDFHSVYVSGPGMCVQSIFLWDGVGMPEKVHTYIDLSQGNFNNFHPAL